MSIRKLIVRPVSRRTLLKGAGVALGLPFLEAMRPRSLAAQTVVPQRFLAFFCPCGTEPSRWEPSPTDAITEADLTECLVDLAGFEAEQEWPASGPVFSDITWVTNVDHEAVCADIHNPSMALSAHHARGASPEVTPQPTLDQYLAARIQEQTPYRSLTSSATGDTAITQGFLSFRENGQSEAVFRNATDLFDTVFSGLDPAAQAGGAPMEIRSRDASILDYAQEDALRLSVRLGAADRQRMEAYLTSVRELEQQIQNTTVTAGCTLPVNPENTRDMHTNTKLMLDLTIMAFQCDLTRVAVVQYSNSWDVHYGKYELPDGCGDWSDHFISHKLDDNDRATDLDDIISDPDRGREEALRIANARVVQTSRFKARRFANVVSALKAAPGANGTLFDETLALYCSENGDGDSHSRKRVPYMLAGRSGGFVPGRVVDAGALPTGGLHASILGYYGIEVDEYGDPASGPIPGL
jgi:Protein of unknown function (DUF1552)